MSTDAPLKGGDRLIATQTVTYTHPTIEGMAPYHLADEGDELIVCRVKIGRLEVVKLSHPLLKFDIFEGQYKRKE